MYQEARLMLAAVAALSLAGVVAAQSTSARALLEQSAEAMGGLARIQSLDNVVLTGFGQYMNQLGDGNLSANPHAPGKWQAATDAQRSFDLKNERALNRDRRVSMFPFAVQGNPNRSNQVQTGVAVLDHPLTALLEALDPETNLGAVRTENDLQVVEFTIEQGATLWLALDPNTHLPAWVRWISGSTTIGDITNTAYFTGYLPFDGIELPVGITTTIDWRNTTLSEFQVDSYHVNAPKLPPFPAPAAPPAAAPPITAQATPLAKGVWDVRYGGNGGAVIEFADHLTMFEAYANEAATFARLDLANTLVPGKKVTELIVSHHHFDHSGGLRAAVDEQLTLEDATMRVDVYRAVGHLHMADAVFAYIPSHRILLEGDFTTFDWDWNWWGGAYMDNMDRYRLDPALNVPVHGKVTSFAETVAAIEKQVANAKKYCAANARNGIYTAGCPAQYSRDPN